MSIEIHLWRTLFGITVVFGSGVFEIPPIFALPGILIYWIGLMLYRREKTDDRGTKEENTSL